MIPSSFKPEFRSAYEAILNEGVEKGVEKEKINTIMRGYENGLNLEILASISNLSIDAVKEIIHNYQSRKPQD